MNNVSIAAVEPLNFAGLSSGHSSHNIDETGEGCIANISPLERRKRLQFGVVQFVITLATLGALVAFDVNPLWRLPLLFMFWASAVGYFQARDKT